MSKRPGIAVLSAQPRGVEADTPLGELLADLETIASYEETLREKIEVCPGVGPKRIIDTAVRIREAAKLLSGAAPQPPGVDVGKLRELELTSGQIRRLAQVSAGRDEDASEGQTVWMVRQGELSGSATAELRDYPDEGQFSLDSLEA